MSDLVTFLLAQLDADEAAARAATPGPWEASTYYPNVPDDGPRADEPCGYGVSGDPHRVVGHDPLEIEPADSFDGAVSKTVAMWMDTEPGFRDAAADAAHIARHDPARVLADCEALRAVVALHDPVDPCDAHNASFETVPCDTLLALAQPFAGRPGWDESWRMNGHKEAQA